VRRDEDGPATAHGRRDALVEAREHAPLAVRERLRRRGFRVVMRVRLVHGRRRFAHGPADLLEFRSRERFLCLRRVRERRREEPGVVLADALQRAVVPLVQARVARHGRAR
jgi:hypothetical protein